MQEFKVSLSKAAPFFFTAIALLGCSRTSAPPNTPRSPAPVASKPAAAAKQLNAEQAFNVLQVELKKHRVPDLDCLSFVIENDPTGEGNGDWEYGAREIHNEQCGGDPETKPIRDRYMVTAAGKVMAYDIVNGEYHPL